MRAVGQDPNAHPELAWDQSASVWAESALPRLGSGAAYGSCQERLHPWTGTAFQSPLCIECLMGKCRPGGLLGIRVLHAGPAQQSHGCQAVSQCLAGSLPELLGCVMTPCCLLSTLLRQGSCALVGGNASVGPGGPQGRHMRRRLVLPRPVVAKAVFLITLGSAHGGLAPGKSE